MPVGAAATVCFRTGRLTCCVAAENGLSFIETSALGASNVESAFQTILTGACPRILLHYAYSYSMCRHTDIYRIVSSKSLEQSEDPIKPPTGDTIQVSQPVDSSANSGGKCC